ncbi:hypothetical protein [Erysipelothrix piscisicarius]
MEYVNHATARPMHRMVSADMMGSTMTANDLAVTQSIVMSWEIESNI